MDGENEMKHEDEMNGTTDIFIGLSDIHTSAKLNGAYLSASSDDDDSSSDGSMYRKRSSADSVGDSDSEIEALTGRGDTRIASRLRVLVGLLFVSIGICFPTVIFITSRNGEVESFEDSFDVLASKVTSTTALQLAQKLAAVQSLGVAATSHTETTQDTWPNVTLSDFDLRAESVRDLGNVLSVNLHPLVTQENVLAWEAYSVENIEWLAEAQERSNSFASDRALLQVRRQWQYDRSRDRVLQSNESEPIISGQIFTLDLDSEAGVSEKGRADGDCFPTWQSLPAIQSVINLDAKSVLPTARDAIEMVINTEQAVLSRTQLINSTYAENEEEEILQGIFRDWIEDALGEGASVEGSMAILYFPIFDRFDLSTRKVVGVISAAFYFEQFFAGVLPADIDSKESVVCVVENACGDSFSYKISGSETTFLGEGDLHDRDFNNYVEQFAFNDIGDAKPYVYGAMNVPLNSDYCPYSLRVYPHDDLHNANVTKEPAIYALSIALVIVFISVTSLAYDHYVQRRMRRAVNFAKENRAIVSSLFPANVRDRLIQDGEDRIREEYYPRRRNSLSSKPSGGDNSRRNSNEARHRRYSNDNGRRFSNDSRLDKRRNSTDNGLADYFPFGSAVAGLTSIALAPAMALAPAKLRLKFFLNEGNTSSTAQQHQYPPSLQDDPSFSAAHEKPIADLFLNCTVLFADIAGFTAWSSEREPEQVFTLLQTFFQKFDHLARKRSVFKVETIGDCYVAVTGLPDAQSDHAVRMTKFARACMHKVSIITQKLEVTLGPGTGDLRMRFGLHSGPVTAGVLRGEKSRFQLFGDTVNTASRMESTGLKNRIQVSQSTAQLLIESGKENWIVPREDLVHAKGKGEIQTYWVLTQRSPSSVGGQGSIARPKFIQSTLQQSNSDVESAGSGTGEEEEDNWLYTDYEGGNEGSRHFDQSQMVVRGNYDRLIDWQVDLLLRILKQIIAGRDASQTSPFSPQAAIPAESKIFEEVSESIELPKFDAKAARARALPSVVDIPDVVVEELREYVRMIANRYRDNPFHNFAHANHVSMSANKLLGRIVKPEDVDYHRKSVKAVASDLHDYTYGITSDPLSHFAIMISTLIHDVDHTGVSNAQRGIEDPEMAERYKSRSVAEQNSIDLAWSLLMHDSFQNLQKAIFATETEVKRFRQLMVNLVMATDIFDKDQKATRNIRWDKVFHSDLRESVDDSEFRNLKAMIVIEHIMQAADVSHTMQHWQVYTKWNERLFHEMYRAYESGRSTKDPSEGWYKGELWFFDNYVIPLAKKLDECGVFGVTSDECLNYALSNRKEWELKGEQIVEDMVSRRKKRTSYMMSGAMKFNTVAPKRDLATYARRSDTIITGLHRSRNRGLGDKSSLIEAKDERKVPVEVVLESPTKETGADVERTPVSKPKEKALMAPILSTLSPSLQPSQGRNAAAKSLTIVEDFFDTEDDADDDRIYEA